MESIKQLYFTEGLEPNFQGKGDMVESILEVNDYTAMTGEIIKGIFRIGSKIYRYIDMTEIEDDIDAFCGYIEIMI